MVDRYIYILYIYIPIKNGFAVDLPINSMVIFHSYVTVYQRVSIILWQFNIAIEHEHST